jgi:GNAT superfamily N-acetyltransferase
MEFREATLEDEKIVLEILDEFNDYVNSLKKDWDGMLSSSARKNSGQLFQDCIKRGDSKVFVAIKNDESIGFLEIHKVPRLRRSKYYGEIEGMFVREEYYGKEVAKGLMKLAFKWAKEEGLDCLRLYSGFELKRAHAFYKKMGFDEAGITFKNYDLRLI